MVLQPHDQIVHPTRLQSVKVATKAGS
jgi:hypothetical protein